VSKLFTPLKIRDITLKNRIVMSPMCQYSASDGYAGSWHSTHYGTRASGGTGLIIIEATAVSPEGRITPGDLGLWKDDHVAGLKAITDFIHGQNAHAAIQLAHAGRKASCAIPWEGGKQLDENNGGWQTLSASDIPFFESDRRPYGIGKKEIEGLVSCFRNAAVRALEAGFDAIEVHAAHGYLIHQFLSPLSNHRTDEYGGTFENRIRFATEVIDAIRTVWPPAKPLLIRISVTDWTAGGWTPEDSIKLASVLKEKGVDVVDCSSGGNVHNARIPVGPAYQAVFSEALKSTGILTGTVGFITEAKQAETLLLENKADLVLFGRELLRNPYFALKAAKELEEDISWPVQYLRAK